MMASIRAHIIADWRSALGFSSVRLHALAVIVAAIYAAMPMLDPSIAGMLPAPLQAKAIGLYAVVGLALRLTKLKANG